MEKLTNNKIHKVIASYGLCNTGSINIYEIDQIDYTITYSINDYPNQISNIEYNIEEDLLGFYHGEIFIPFSECMRV